MKRRLALAVLAALFAVPWLFLFGAIGFPAYSDRFQIMPRQPSEGAALLPFLVTSGLFGWWCARVLDWALRTLRANGGGWKDLSSRAPPGPRLSDHDA